MIIGANHLTVYYIGFYLLVCHEIVQPLLSRNETPNPLPKHPQRNRERAHGQKARPEHVEHRQRAVLGQPIVDEVRQSERQQVAGVDGNEALLGQVGVRVEDVAEDACGQERETHVGQAVRQHGAGPVRVVVDGGAEAVEAGDAKYDDDDHWDHAEFRLVDAVVALSELDADPVVQGPGDDFADDSEDEGGEAGQAGLRDGEVVGRRDKEHAVDDAEDDDPGEGGSVQEKAPENGWVLQKVVNESVRGDLGKRKLTQNMTKGRASTFQIGASE